MSWKTIVKDNNLSVVSVPFSKLNEETRLDAEYYRPDALFYLKCLEEKNAVPISSVATFVVGPFGSTVTIDKYVDEKDYSYVRNQDVKDFVIKNSEAHIPKELFEKLKQFHIKENDLLVTVVGTLGKVAIAQKKDSKSIFSCKSTIVRCTEIDPYYLATFLNSKVGQVLLLRCKRGAIQEGLNLFDIKTLDVAIPSKEFQTKVSENIKHVFSLYELSEISYSEAEEILLKELKLDIQKPNYLSVSVRKLSECLKDGRFDAEYWQPEYDEFSAKIQRTDTLGEISVIKSGSLIDLNYYSDYGTPYIRGADFSENELKEGGIVYIKPDFKSSKEVSVKENDIIFPSVGSIGKTAIVTKKYENAFISNNLGKITIINKEYLPQYVQVCLQSIVGQLQLERLQTKTAQPKITDTDMARIKIPFLLKETQQKIVEKTDKSRKLKLEAKELLEKVKYAVEIFVEKNEEEALKIIDTQ